MLQQIEIRNNHGRVTSQVHPFGKIDQIIQKLMRKESRKRSIRPLTESMCSDAIFRSQNQFHMLMPNSRDKWNVSVLRYANMILR